MKKLKDTLHPDAIVRLRELVLLYLKSKVSGSGDLSWAAEFLMQGSENVFAMHQIIKADFFGVPETMMFLTERSLALLMNTEGRSGKFVDIFSEAELVVKANDILDELLSFPKKYVVLIPLKNMKLPFIGQVKLSDSASIIQFDSESTSIFPVVIPKSTSLLGIPMEYSPIEDHAYLSICTHGYLVEKIATDTFNKVESIVRQLVSYLYIRNIVNKSDYRAGHRGLTEKDIVLVYEPLSAENNGFVMDLGSELSFLLKLGINSNSFEPTEYFKILNPDQNFNLPAVKQGIFANYINYEKSDMLFSFHGTINGPLLEAVERIRVALEWFYHGLSNVNQTFAFIQYSIAIEALLGDRERKGQLVDRLSDRCSFVIASNIVERKNIRKLFEDIYDVRSKIIHRGRYKLDMDDLKKLNLLGEYLKKGINNEINNLPSKV